MEARECGIAAQSAANRRQRRNFRQQTERVSSFHSCGCKRVESCCANPTADSLLLVFQHKPSSHRRAVRNKPGLCWYIRTSYAVFDLDKNCMRLPKLNSQIGIVKFWVEPGVVKNAGRVKEIASGMRRGRVHLTGVWWIWWDQLFFVSLENILGTLMIDWLIALSDNLGYWYLWFIYDSPDLFDLTKWDSPKETLSNFDTFKLFS